MLKVDAIPDPDEKEKLPPPELLNLYAIPVPPAEGDPNELLKHRFLCRGAGMLLIGPTGVGKSSLAMQCAIQWSLGREAFGIVPTRPLRILIIQAENDPADLAEFRDGVLRGLGITEEEQAGSVVQTAWEDSRTGAEFCEQVLAPLLEKGRFDLVIIDPALAYLGADASLQKDVSVFLRNGLNPLLHKHGCALMLVHHTNKPPQGKEKGGWQAGDFAYLGTGSAEWANWARAVMAIRSLGSHEYFELRVGKRGRRLRWTEDDGMTPKFTKIIAHSATGICWREATLDEFEAAGGVESADVTFRRRGPDMDSFVAIFPTTYEKSPRGGLLSADQIKMKFADRGWHKDLYRAVCDDAEAAGLIVQVRGEGRGGQILRGLPAMAEAFAKHRDAKGTILEDVPLAKPVVFRKKRR